MLFNIGEAPGFFGHTLKLCSHYFSDTVICKQEFLAHAINKGFGKIRADGNTISGKSFFNFSSGETSNADHLFLTSTKYIQSAAVVVGRNTISRTSPSPGR